MPPDADLIPTRRSLLGRLKNWDDEASWNDFFQTYWQLIYGVAIKSGLTDAEAQEVVQETVIIVAKKMPDFKYDPAMGSFKGWLLHTTRWRIADQFRKRKGQGAHGFDSCDDGTATVERVADPAGSQFEMIWDEEWKKTLFEAALENVKRLVKPRHFQIFDLYVVKKWPVQKVARTLKINLGQVYLAKHRVAHLLKKEIKLMGEKMK